MANWNEKAQQYEVWSSLEGRMVPTGQDMYKCSCGILRGYKESEGQAHQHDVQYHDCNCSKCVDNRRR